MKPLGNALERRWRLVVVAHQFADVRHVPLLTVAHEVVAQLKRELLNDVRAALRC